MKKKSLTHSPLEGPTIQTQIRRSHMAMLDWNTYRQHLTVRIGEIAKLSPGTIKGYQTLTAAGQKADLLGPQIRGPISLAVAGTVRWHGCATVPTETSTRHGASRGEVAAGLGCVIDGQHGAA